MTNNKHPAQFPRLEETTCPICGRNFIPPPENTYWLYSKRGTKIIHFCRYNCYTKAQNSSKFRAKENTRKYAKGGKAR